MCMTIQRKCSSWGISYMALDSTMSTLLFFGFQPYFPSLAVLLISSDVALPSEDGSCLDTNLAFAGLKERKCPHDATHSILLKSTASTVGIDVYLCLTQIDTSRHTSQL